MNEAPTSVEFLRHTVAVIAYRAGKSLRDVPAGYGEFELGPGSRRPVQILAHMSDVLTWARSIVVGRQAWDPVAPESWEKEVDRFFERLEELDAALVRSEEPPALRLLQGPLADTLTHVGQLAMLRRVAGSPVRGENYFRAKIVEGRVGSEQASSPHEFD